MEIKQLLQQQVRLMKKFNFHPDWRYNGFEELVLVCGKEMQPRQLPKKIKRGMPKYCYANCQELLKRHPELIYCEGYALTEAVSFPVVHAWLTDKHGRSIDPTWESPGLAYFGVPFSTKWLQSFLEERQKRGRGNDRSVFEGNYIERHSLLKRGLPPKAIARQRISLAEHIDILANSLSVAVELADSLEEISANIND